MTNLFDVQGKIALVTGSTGTLGYSFARGLAEHGAIVVLNGRNTGRLSARVSELKESGCRAHGYAFNVTSSKEVRDAVKRIGTEVGPVDILVNNAGITLRAPLDKFSEQDWSTVIGTNLTSAFLVAKEVAKTMIERGAGKIINIGSVQSELGRPDIAPYAASKGGLKMLTKGMAADWAKHNIQVNGIGPGYFKTEMTRPLYEDPRFDTWLCGRTPSGRWGEPRELIGALLFLSSEASSYVNGHMLYVDGGLTSTV